MQFLYTGASNYQAAQNDSNLSLGGYISSSTVPNDQLNNLFSDISAQTSQQKRSECKGLILKNTLEAEVKDVIFGYKYPTNSNFKLEVAFVNINTNNPQQVEKIPTAQATPYYATFNELDITTSENNSQNIGDLNVNDSILIWFKRTILDSTSLPTFSTLDEEVEFWKLMSNPTYNQIKEIEFVIKYSVED